MFILAEVSLDLSLVYLILLNFILIIYAIYLIIFMIPFLIKAFGWEDILLKGYEEREIITILKERGFTENDDYFYKDTGFNERIFVKVAGPVISLSQGSILLQKPLTPALIIKGYPILFWEIKFNSFKEKTAILNHFNPERIVYI